MFRYKKLNTLKNNKIAWYVLIKRNASFLTVNLDAETLFAENVNRMTNVSCVGKKK
jgi:hypothetical protein